MITPNEDHDFVAKCTSCSGLIIHDNKLIDALSIINELENPEDENMNKNHKEVLTKLQNTDEFNSRIDCPKCHCGMESYEYMYSSRIIIDRCPMCNAVWLECGKLDKIKKYRESLNTKENEEKLRQIMPQIIDIKREVSNTFQRIKEESSIFGSKSSSGNREK
jgi:Zn-finger nucleic acid-binding protein